MIACDSPIPTRWITTCYGHERSRFIGLNSEVIGQKYSFQLYRHCGGLFQGAHGAAGDLKFRRGCVGKRPAWGSGGTQMGHDGKTSLKPENPLAYFAEHCPWPSATDEKVGFFCRCVLGPCWSRAAKCGRKNKRPTSKVIPWPVKELRASVLARPCPRPLPMKVPFSNALVFWPGTANNRHLSRWT